MKGFLEFMIDTPNNLVTLIVVLMLGGGGCILAYNEGVTPIVILWLTAMVLMVINKVLLYRKNK